MNKKLKIYLDTSVINFLFADDAPEKKEVTIDFFENYVAKEKYDVFISEVVFTVINDTSNQKKKIQLLNVLKKYPIKYVEENISDEIIYLANQYITYNALPQNSKIDALHIAISVVNKIDILLSWNYKHLVNFNRKRKVININLVNNYFYPFDILTPMEVIDYDNN